MSKTPVVDLEMRISSGIFEMWYSGALEETGSWKKPEVENLVALSL
jgi:hypothetical protein